jgi:hypothetical protein
MRLSGLGSVLLMTWRAQWSYLVMWTKASCAMPLLHCQLLMLVIHELLKPNCKLNKMNVARYVRGAGAYLPGGWGIPPTGWPPRRTLPRPYPYYLYYTCLRIIEPRIVDWYHNTTSFMISWDNVSHCIVVLPQPSSAASLGRVLINPVLQSRLAECPLRSESD